MKKQIGEVLSVKVSELADGRFFVEAVGQVTGWTDPVLASQGAIVSREGTLDYNFLAEPPPRGAITAQVLQKITATAYFGGPGTDLRGLTQVRVFGFRGAKSARFPP